MKKKISKAQVRTVVVFGLFAVMMIFDAVSANSAFAALPWEGPIDTLTESLTGPMAKAVCAATVCVTGIFIALGEGGPFGRIAGRIIFGLALAIGAMNIVKMFG